jgi:hypothetical protein
VTLVAGGGAKRILEPALKPHHSKMLFIYYGFLTWRLGDASTTSLCGAILASPLRFRFNKAEYLRLLSVLFRLPQSLSKRLLWIALLTQDDREQFGSAYGINTARLCGLKRRYDPDDVFTSAIPLPVPKSSVFRGTRTGVSRLSPNSNYHEKQREVAEKNKV